MTGTWTKRHKSVYIITVNCPLQVSEVVHSGIFELRIVGDRSQVDIAAPSELHKARMRRRHEVSLERAVILVAWNCILLEDKILRQFRTPFVIFGYMICTGNV